MNRKQRRAAQKRGPGPGSPAGPPGDAQAAALYANAVRLHQAGGLADAARLCRDTLALVPGHLGALHLLGTIALQSGRAAEAAEHFRRVISLKPDLAPPHLSLGHALVQQGEIAAAARAFEQALALKPEQPQPAEFASIFLSLAKLSTDRRNFDEATRLYLRVLALAPGLAQAHNDFGAMLLARGEPAAASARFAEAVRLVPELFERYGDLVTTLRKVNPQIAAAIDRANEAWPNRLPLDALIGAGGLAAVASDPLFVAMLELSTVRDLGLERLLTALRRGVLEAADDNVANESMLALAAALARQCFVNEYLFEPLPDEATRVERLQQAIGEAVSSGGAVSALQLAAIACYDSLGSQPFSERLLDRDWPKPIASLLTQQVREPLQERALREAIPRLTPIVDEASLRVQRQYEENPYPRWVLPASQQEPVSLFDDLRKRFPAVALANPPSGKPIDILVAGCGTGHHPIGVARRYRDARVLAIDLSLASLGYAQRKTRELGVHSIEYAQADILQLGSLGRSFDLIDAGGVLHHLADPTDGWRVLCTLLRPNGFMRIALYSELGRADVVAARALIAARGYHPTVHDIRRCRRELADTDLSGLAKFHDFFSTSECRDLLFHVQEHRLNLPQIGEFLRAQRLRFIGFELDPAIERLYRSRFPDDRALTNLDHWHEFETARPATFAAMYQFWVQAV